MDKKFFFLVGTLVVSLALVPLGTAKQNEETKDTFEDIFNAADNDDLFTTSSDQEEEVYHYTSEEIERNRWISLSRDGVETKATDEEVIRILDYARHDNATSQFTEPFNITLDESHQTANKVKRTIFGSDNRYGFPGYGMWDRSCALGIMQNGCTAFLIGFRHAVTAGHCVYDYRHKRWKQGLGIYIERDCSNYGRFIDWRQVWVVDANGSPRYDMAYILLSSSASCTLGFGFQDPMPRTHVETCGYHSDKRYSTYPCYFCSNCYAELEVTGSWWSRKTHYTRMRSQCDIYGASGSPMAVSGRYAWGIHTHSGSSYNYAVRITKERFTTLCQWLCDTGYKCRARC